MRSTVRPVDLSVTLTTPRDTWTVLARAVLETVNRVPFTTAEIIVVSTLK
ncbi:hypothetical protein [Alsobacter sp. R-9]